MDHNLHNHDYQTIEFRSESDNYIFHARIVNKLNMMEKKLITISRVLNYQLLLSRIV